MISKTPIKAFEWTEAQQQVWDEWVKTRPECIQKMCASHPADNIYQMKSTKQIVTMISYSEDGTVKVEITNKYVNQVAFDREVFGVDINDLELWNGDKNGN